MATSIRKICEICRGNAVIPTLTGDIDCSACEPTGDNPWGTLETAPNVFDAYLVLECIDITEFSGLTEAQQSGVKLLLSCGQVDLNEGKAGKVRLWNWFGEESDTVANLTELLAG